MKELYVGPKDYCRVFDKQGWYLNYNNVLRDLSESWDEEGWIWTPREKEKECYALLVPSSLMEWS